MTTAKPHPAKFTDVILDAAANILGDHIDGGERLLDPFAGTGKVFNLLDRFPHLDITALEIEPEWAAWDDRILVGDALDNGFPDNWFQVVFTSPAYGNRMADSFNATESRKRNTYHHKLGRKPSPNSSATLQWGEKYREFHRDAWTETWRVLEPGGLLLLNVKDHIRNGEVQEVSQWHMGYFAIALNAHLVETAKVTVNGNRQGQNGSARVPFENLYLFQKGS